MFIILTDYHTEQQFAIPRESITRLEDSSSEIPLTTIYVGSIPTLVYGRLSAIVDVINNEDGATHPSHGEHPPSCESILT